MIAMWLILALASAFFAGLTAVLAKYALDEIPSHLATAVRTTVVWVFAWGIVLTTKALNGIAVLTGETWIFLILSGLATGGSWLFYYKALQNGTVSQVAPVDKSSTILIILLAWIFFSEPVTAGKAVGVLLLGAGTWLMIQKQPASSPSGAKHRWFAYAAGAAVFAALSALFGKMGIQQLDSNLGTAIRTTVVLVLAWGMAVGTGQQKHARQIDRRSWIFLILSGLATGGSWLCYYRALQDGPVSAVVPIDKLSILFTIILSGIFLRERLSRKALGGLILLVAGTLAIALF